MKKNTRAEGILDVLRIAEADAQWRARDWDIASEINALSSVVSNAEVRLRELRTKRSEHKATKPADTISGLKQAWEMIRDVEIRED